MEGQWEKRSGVVIVDPCSQNGAGYYSEQGHQGCQRARRGEMGKMLIVICQGAIGYFTASYKIV